MTSETTITPETIPNAFIDAWNENDADRLAGLFAQDAEFVNVVGMWWHNRERIRKAHAIAFDSFFRHAKGEVVRTKVRYLTDDVAVVHWRWKMAAQTDAEGGEASGRTGVFTMVAQRTMGEWLVVAAQNTDVIPGAETILADGDARTAVRYTPRQSNENKK